MVQMQVDMQRREQLRRLHTTTHIINYCAKQVLGNHVWQNGSNLKPEIGTLDITHFDQLSREEIQKIEDMANETVFENKEVTIEEIERTKAEKKYGFELYQGGAIPMKNLRIIKVMDSDIEACGGIHMLSTGGIGLIKIIDAQKIQDGIIRLSYVVREFALEYIQNNEALLENTAEIFSVQKNHVEKTASKFFNEWKEQKKQIEQLNATIKEMALSQVTTSSQTQFTFLSLDMGGLNEIMSKALENKSSCKITSDKFIAATTDFEINEYKKKLDKGSFNIYII